jgi:hypothetical protein
VDTLTGGDPTLGDHDLDWFFAALGDRVTDLKPGEHVS